MNTRHKPSLARALAALAAAAACAGVQAAVIPPGTVLAARQEMVRNNGAEPESLDPAYIESVNAGEITRDLFEGLTSSDHHSNVVPGVAESWKQVDATTWVFKLRKNAVWSNGTPVTAEDFVYSWRRFLDPKTAAKIATTYGIYLANGLDVVNGKKPVTDLGVRAIDAQTLEVRTAGPVPFLPALVAVAQYGPQPRAIVEKFGKDWTKPGNMVSNGAYVLKDWQVNSKVVVEKNPTYWDAANVQLTRVTFLCVEDGNADLKLYQSGENDFMQQIAPLLTMLPGFVQSLPNFSITALGCGAYCATDITAGRKGTGPAVRTSSVCLSIAFTPSSVPGFLPLTTSMPLSR